ncbi:MAG: agmatinase [Chloroflexi bacterium]|nr:agmatinase [Chloroflexota bacterium]
MTQPPRDSSLWPDSHATPRSFFATTLCQDLDRLEAQVAFLGVPFDQGTLARPGARYGPNAIRDARVYSYVDIHEGTVAGGYWDPAAGRQQLAGVTMADCGDVNIVPSEVERNFLRLTRTVEKVLDRGVFPVIVGGDHAITYPIVRALERYKPLDIVHFDAHMDYVHDYQGVLFSHGSPMRRCSELPFVRHITSIGVRDFKRRPYQEAVARGNLVISADEFRRLGPAAVVQQIPASQHLYVTIDIDCLDPSVAPGTGTPVPGGLTYLEVRDTLRLLPGKGKAVAFDVVEVAPNYDWAELTSRVAARLIIEFLTVLFPPTAESK